LDLSGVPFFDNHTHTLNASATRVTPVELACNFLHGYRDILPKKDGEPFGISAEQAMHLANMGGVLSMVNRLALKFSCAPTIEAVTSERNKRTANGVGDYVKSLYAEANIVGTVVDSDLPIGHETVGLFPCKVFRLLNMDALFFKLLREASSYSEMREGFRKRVEHAIKTEGYCGLKCHVAEEFTLAVRLVDRLEAEKAFPDAARRVRKAVETTYFGIFAEALLQCQELDIPIHLHTGVTGQSAITGQPGIAGEQREGLLSDMDPFLLAPLLKEKQFYNTTMVLLHGGYPWLRNTAMMAHLFPHVWLDTSWTIPWGSLENDRCLEELLALAPHSKIMCGSGQHGIPEIGWLAAIVARTSLATVLEEKVKKGLLAESQATTSAEMILYKNAKRLYRF
jgi:uncharacterized protein